MQVGRRIHLTLRHETARPNGVLRGGVGSVNRRRPLKPLEEHFQLLQKKVTIPPPHFINDLNYTVFRRK